MGFVHDPAPATTTIGKVSRISASVTRLVSGMRGHRSMRRAATALVLVAGIATSCAGTRTSPDETTSTTSSGSLNAPEGGFEVDNLPSQTAQVDGEYINVPWSDLEPTEGSFTGPGWTAIDNALADNPRTLKIRPVAGWDAPGWVKSSDGPAVTTTLNDPNRGVLTGTIARFWETSNQYWSQYRALLDEIDRRFGANPKLSTVTACGAVISDNCEPPILGQSGAALYKAGLTEATDRAAMLKSVQEVADALPNQRVSFAAHYTWTVPTASGTSPSWPKERDELLVPLRNTYGDDKLVIQNNGVGGLTASTWNGPIGTAPDLSAFIRNDPGRDGFQCGCKGVAGTTIMSIAVDHLRGEFMENIPSGLTSAQINSYDTAMKNNANAIGPSPTPTPTPTA